MTAHVVPDEVLSQHIAVLGKTGSGKTSTAKLIVEQVVAEGARVCVLDPIKSDWWGLVSSADGKHAGLPFNILGGPRGHVQLHSGAGRSIGELVASASLPLSIIDMADFEPGGQARFFIDFAPALIRRMRGVLYLVIEEAHLFAPKERSGVGNENMSVHWAKTLATAGRSKGIRLIVATQRTQALHNAVLGSCDTMIAHRLTAPADQEPVIKWLKTNVSDSDVRSEVADSLASLKTGDAWLCSGEADLFERRHFPRISTYDNTATPTGDDEEITVKTVSVDRDKLRSIIGEAVAQAEAEDPKMLQKRIADLEHELLVFQHPGPIDIGDGDQVDGPALEAAEQKGYERGLAEAHEFQGAQLDKLAHRLTDAISSALTDARREVPTAITHAIEARPTPAAPAIARGNGSDEPRIARQITPRASDLTPKAQTILNALAELRQLRSASPTRELVAIMSGYAHTRSKGFTNAIGALRSAGLIEPSSNDGFIVLSPEGLEKALAPARPRTERELQDRLISMLGGASGKILQPLIAARGRPVDRAEVMRAGGYDHPRSKGFTNAIGRLRGLGFIDYPTPGTVVAKPVLFLR